MKPADIDAVLVTAITKLRSGNLRGADDDCTSLLTAVPRHPGVHQLLAVVAQYRNDLPQARKHIDISLQERPTHVATLLLAGRLARDADDLSAAVSYFRRAAGLAPDAGEPAFLLGSAHLALSEIDDAVHALQIARKLDPRSKEIAFNLGAALQKKNLLADACVAFEHAVSLDATFASAWFALGVARQDMQQLTLAAGAFRSALQYKTDYSEAAVNLGIVLQQMGKLQDAIAAYQTAIKLDPSSFGRISHALSGASTGTLLLDLNALKQLLTT